MVVKYYAEVNLVCILFLVVLIIFTNQTGNKNCRLSSGRRVLKLLLLTTVIMCISDMAAGICRGQFFPGARVLIEISNLLYYETVSVVSFLWLVFVFSKLGIIRNYKSGLLLWALPLMLITAIICVNPLTNWMFIIDENNLYARNAGVYFHWLISWGYLIVATVASAYKTIREPDKSKRRETRSLLSFIIAPSIAAAVQMLFYGVTCFQVGVVISLLITYLNDQNDQILTDALTGLSNRYGFDKYWESYTQHHAETHLTLMMIDVDSFKQINDKFSHLEGDRALTEVANAVKNSCEAALSKWRACRYGGDEFVLSACDCAPEEIEELKEKIRKQLAEINHSYTLSVSIGTATGMCANADDIDRLLLEADKSMYEEKKRIK